MDTVTRAQRQGQLKQLRKIQTEMEHLTIRYMYAIVIRTPMQMYVHTVKNSLLHSVKNWLHKIIIDQSTNPAHSTKVYFVYFNHACNYFSFSNNLLAAYSGVSIHSSGANSHVV